ncbi:MAG: bifunctional 5,10-methylene-tetrahydrofolate dehydrogenase/5,10-methylene-tetrahydrofolate cyclohydrolase, partial [Chloroflexi bacterium]|nr:bifunctional 5,10-methylene-tetrahydrofolate dehydrogenase/5,10-methylene-tetrahydrofolate cyclohydrolase [Chloroflexota bacterium]
MAVLELIRTTGVTLQGKDVAVVGAGAVSGKPLSLLLLNEMCTVTVCHVATRDLASHTLRADILIVAVGKPGLIAADMVKPGAVVVDVGINTVAPSEKGPPALGRTGQRKKK